MDDWQLLQEYARRGSEAAFRSLVERHIGLVHAAARRQVADSQLAEEVTQAVFILLARKAGSLRQGVVLPGWLFRTTRFVAARALRAERRRHQREQEACEMQNLESVQTAGASLSPLLDEALGRLGERERNAVLLRFAHDQSLREVGRQLGISEEAAKKRVSRALERLRSFFAGRGFTVSIGVLAGVFAHELAQGAPAALATRIVAGALTANIANYSALPALVRETLEAWRWARLKLASALTGSVAGLICLGVLIASARAPASGQRAKAESKPAAEQSDAVNPAAAQRSSKPSKERSMQFRVVAKDTGAPVAGAPLGINTVVDGQWKRRFDVATDENGVARIVFPRFTGRLDVGVMASGFAARCATWRTDADAVIPAEYTMRVDRVTNWMGGWLRDPTGRPVADAVVEVEFGISDMAQEENPRERPGFVSPAPVARSDRKGWWTCALVAPNARYLPGIRARHPAFAPARIITGTLSEEPGTHAEPLKLLWSGKLVTVMGPGLKLTGRILTEEGKPVANARVEHEPASFETLHTQSDADGGFAFEGLAAGSFDFLVTAPGFAQQYLKVEVSEGMPPLEVSLKAGGVLRLRVEDENGEPIPGGFVALTGPAGVYSPQMSWMAGTGPDGRVEWTSAPADQRLNLGVSRLPEFATSRGILVKADGEEHVIRLRRALTISGRVTDAQTGEPIREEIKAFPGYGQGEHSWYRGETRRSTDGTYKVYFREGSLPWRFRVEAEGYSPFVSEALQPEKGGQLDRDIALEPVDQTRIIRGVVRGTDGQPAMGAQVTLIGPEQSASLGQARFSRRSSGSHVILEADAAGRFAFPEEPEAKAVVAVSSNGFARVTLAGLNPPLEIRLQPWGHIDGTIDPSARNRPAPYVMIDDLLALDSQACLRLEMYAKPTEDGRFAFDFVPPGLLCVWLNAGALENPTVPLFHHATWVQVTAGATTPVCVAETGYRIKGRFIRAGRSEIQTGYAALEGDWPPESASGGYGLGTRQWIRSFFDPGRLNISPGGDFESRDPIAPGDYRLVGKIDGVRVDQSINVPDPSREVFQSDGGLLGRPEAQVVDLGQIPIP